MSLSEDPTHADLEVQEHRVSIPNKAGLLVGNIDSAQYAESSQGSAPIEHGSEAQKPDRKPGRVRGQKTSSADKIGAEHSSKPIAASAGLGQTRNTGSSINVEKIHFDSLEPSTRGKGEEKGGPGGGGSRVSESKIADAKISSKWIRNGVIALCTLVALISYLDRACIGVAIIPMAEEYGWSESTKGGVSSIFFLGYTATNLAGGFWATKYGAKLVLATGVVVWSVFTILTPISAASGSLVALLFVRTMMGAGEGVAFPTVQQVISDWTPLNLRTRTNSIIFSGSFLGTILSYATAPTIIRMYGWKSVFIIYGACGVAWLLFWVYLIPQEGPLALVKQEDRRKLKVSDVPWKRILTNKMVWAILITQSFEGVGQYVIFFWIPSYYNSHFGVDVEQSATLSISPWVFTIIFTLGAGYMADKIVNKGLMKLIHVRKLFQSIAGIGGAVCFLGLSYNEHAGSHGALVSMFIVTITMSLSAFGVAGADCSPMDISPKYAAIIFGFINGLSTLAASTSIWLTGVILDNTHSNWPLVFQLVALLNVLGVIVYNLCVTSDVQIE